MADRFLIAPFDSGLRKDVKPFMIPDNAFAELKNAYIFRGRVKKRFGSELSGYGATDTLQQSLYSRCAINMNTICTSSVIATTDGSGDLTATQCPGSDFRIGQKFVIGTTTFTVTALGTPGVLDVSVGGTGTGTYNTTTGMVTFSGADHNAAVNFYPYGIGGTTDGSGKVSGIMPGKIWKIGQNINIDNVLFTVVSDTAGFQDMHRTDYSGTPPQEKAKFNITTGEYDIEIALKPSKTVYCFLTEPIMGLWQYETAPVNNQVAYAFDTQFIYFFNTGRWVQTGPSAGYRFHGDDDEFFWVANYQGINPSDTVMFVTNFHVVNPTGAADGNDDPMWCWDGSTWSEYAPTLVSSTGKKLISARIILSFHRRLIMFDTIEQTSGVNARFRNRCRFSHDGSPIEVGSPTYNYPFLEPNQQYFSGGGFVDASTQEGIISAEFIKDRLIVYFEQSTWELAYTGNEIEPFIWLRLNSELGSEGTNSSVRFDKVILTVGANGIHGCNGTNVERLDLEIPDYVFGIDNENSGPARVHGIRDFKTEMVYWTMPLANKCANSYFPNTVLTFNYRTGSWGENDDCFTTFGYFCQTIDKSWSQMNMEWQQCNFSWDSYVVNSKEKVIIAGNPMGYIVVLNPELTANAQNMPITDFLYDPATKVSTIMSYNNTLQPGDFIKIYNLNGITLDAADQRIHQVVTASNTLITLNDLLVVSGSYKGGGEMCRISRVSIKSKEWNFYLKDGRNFLVSKMDFYVTRNSGTYVTDFNLNSSTDGLVDDSVGNDVALGDCKIFLGGQLGIESMQERLWRGQFFQAEGNTIQLWLYVDVDDMKKPENAFSGLEIHAIMIHARPTALVMEDQANVR